MSKRTESHESWITLPACALGALLLYAAGYGPSLSLAVRFPAISGFLDTAYEPLSNALKHAIGHAWINLDPYILAFE